MGAIEIKGVRIGEGRPKAIVSLMDADVSGLLASARACVAAGADCLEWRADLFAQVGDLMAVAETCRRLAEALPETPLIVTLRTEGQGGRLAPSAQEYRAFCEAVIATGAPDLIDLELGQGGDAVRELVFAAHERGVRAIVSHHDFGGTPEVARMEGLLLRMAELGADIPKLAVMAHDANDAEALMEATRRAGARLDVPLLTMAMGKAGRITRLEGERFGSALTFCARGRASAPGQVELAEALIYMDALHGKLKSDHVLGR